LASSTATATAAEMEQQQREATTALQAQAAKSGKPIDIFEGPSHTLPPVGLLFDAFMEEMLRTTKVSPNSNENDSDRVAKKDQILYQQAEDVQPVQPHNGLGSKGGKTKKVSEGDMLELEAFFKEVLSNSE
jgi:NET1-associated nuclear protein 1 (U3 small nucleolar RNA-associated protein 17)